MRRAASACEMYFSTIPARCRKNCGMNAALKHAGELRRWRGRGLGERVLLDHMPGDREEIGFRGSNRLDVRDPKHSQVDLLDDVGDIGGVADPGEEEAAQLSPVAHHEPGYERLGIFSRQGSLLILGRHLIKAVPSVDTAQRQAMII